MGKNQNEMTICYHCLELFPAYEDINSRKVQLLPAGKMCSFCAYLEEHRSPFRSEGTPVFLKK